MKRKAVVWSYFLERSFCISKSSSLSIFVSTLAISFFKGSILAFNRELTPNRSKDKTAEKAIRAVNSGEKGFKVSMPSYYYFRLVLSTKVLKTGKRTYL